MKTRTRTIDPTARAAIEAVVRGFVGDKMRFTECVEPRVYFPIVYDTMRASVVESLRPWCRSISCQAACYTTGVRKGWYRVRAKIKAEYIRD